MPANTRKTIRVSCLNAGPDLLLFMATTLLFDSGTADKTCLAPESVSQHYLIVAKSRLVNCGRWGSPRQKQAAKNLRRIHRPMGVSNCHRRFTSKHYSPVPFSWLAASGFSPRVAIIRATFQAPSSWRRTMSRVTPESLIGSPPTPGFGVAAIA